MASNTPNRIMLIRHAEKPDGKAQGVTKDGAQDDEELIVRGWQRSGALVRFFAPRSDEVDPHLAQPKTIFASAVGPHSKSLRPQHTILPLAKLLGLTLDLSCQKSEVTKLAAAVVKADGPVLIAWEHEMIPAIVNAIVGDTKTCPQQWDGARFDIVWVLDRKTTASGWDFFQVPQLLLPGDSDRPIT
jgi:hypothetical protein